MKLAWITDPHLNFAEREVRDELYASVGRAGAHALLLGGDIGEAGSVVALLREIEAGINRPVYFVLGNHDFYGSSITQVRTEIAGVSPRTVWLPTAGVVALNDRAALVGHDGWADGRLGDFFASRVVLNDYLHIADLAVCNLAKDCLYATLNRLGDDSATYVEGVLRRACESFMDVILLTHVPPFREACWHEGKLPNGEWLPHFTCKAMGDAILRVMWDFPDRRLTVLCGHTHGAGVSQVAPNVVVKTGGAAYGAPVINEVLEL